MGGVDSVDEVDGMDIMDARKSTLSIAVHVHLSQCRTRSCKCCQDALAFWGTEAGGCVPPGSSGIGAVVTLGNVVKRARIRIEPRLDIAGARLVSLLESLVYEGEQSGVKRGDGARAPDDGLSASIKTL
jgi:hypothetical protein